MKRSIESRWKQGATRLGISYDRYRSLVENGWRWCSGHQAWEPVSWFGRHSRRADGLNSTCRAFDRANARRNMARLRAERKASS